MTRLLQKTIRDFREGLGYLLLITVPLFVLCILAGIRGYLDGGDPYIASYQMRFIYLMPVYGTIGFICLNDENRLRNFLTAFSFAMIFKAHQGAFMRFFYYGHYNEQEYLITHYYSAFVPLAVCFIYYQLRYETLNRKLYWLYLSSLPSFLVTLVANDRRTAYAGLAFSFLVLVLVGPFKALKQRKLRVAIVFAAISLSILIGLSSLLFLTQDSTRGPYIGKTTEELSYRQQENAGLLLPASENPFIGIGFGKELINRFGLINIENIYSRYKTVPHNQILAMWGFGGSYVVSWLSVIFVLMLAYSLRPFQKLVLRSG